MAEVNRALTEEGWLVNQSRMWAASQWTVRAGARWRDGERRMYRHLVDGSTGRQRPGLAVVDRRGDRRPYGFSRWQVEKRAPELCAGCALRERCPVQRWPEAVSRGSGSTRRTGWRATPTPTDGRTRQPQRPGPPRPCG